MTTLAQDSPPLTAGEADLLISLGSIVLVACGLLAFGVARLTASGRLGVNGWAGIRTKATRHSEAAWLAGHRAAEKLLMLVGLLIIASAGIGVFVSSTADPADGERRALLWSGSVVVGSIAVVAVTALAASRANRAARAATS